MDSALLSGEFCSECAKPVLTHSGVQREACSRAHHRRLWLKREHEPNELIKCVQCGASIGMHTDAELAECSAYIDDSIAYEMRRRENFFQQLAASGRQLPSLAPAS